MEDKGAISGIISEAELPTLVSKDVIDTILSVFPDMYGRLVGKRIDADYFLEIIADGSLHACDYLLGSDMEMEPVPGYSFTSWEHGYGDFRLIPDLNSLRICDWLDKTAIVICDVYKENGIDLVEEAPRSILKKQIKRLKTLGFQANIASELEFYLFKDSYDEIYRKEFNKLETSSHYMDDYNILQGTKEEDVIGAIRRHVKRSGIPVEFSKGETGHGQQEINLRYSNPLEMADRHVIYKQAVKEIAWQKGKSVTFMSKWNHNEAGSSMHIHLSLLDEKTLKPIFPGFEKISGHETSSIFRWFLGGWMRHVAEMFPFYAPYPTSYKRYVKGTFAPTKIAWGYENRTAGFRIVGEGDSLRIECRFPGSDANPYLAFAASLAAGIDGIENQIEPGDPISGNAYNLENIQSVSKNLVEATESLRDSKWARSAFTSNVVDHYSHFFLNEQLNFDSAVTDWERARYFERA